MDRTYFMRAEVKVDCYCGESCEEKEKFWHIHTLDDMEAEETREDILDLKLSNLPMGAIVSIEVPQCPECFCLQECCDCGFAWNNLIEEEYS